MESEILRGAACYKREKEMITTPEQDKKLKIMDKELRGMFPDFFGSVRFNLNPKVKKFNINVVENIIEEP